MTDQQYQLTHAEAKEALHILFLMMGNSHAIDVEDRGAWYRLRQHIYHRFGRSSLHATFMDLLLNPEINDLHLLGERVATVHACPREFFSDIGLFLEQFIHP